MESDMLTTVNGLEISYRAHGVGPTLVLIHAFPLSKAMWEGQVAALADTCHVVTVDLRGFGKSQLTDGVFDLDDLADDVHALLRKLGHEHVVLGGLSMGGYVAFAYWRRHRASVRGLILADTKSGTDNPAGLAKREAMIEEVQQNGMRGVSRAFPRAVVAPETAERQPALIERLRVWIEDASPATVMGAQRAMARRSDATALLSGIDVPTLVLVGEHDPTTPVADAEAIASAIPGAKLVCIPGAGHLSNLENPEAFNDAVKEFMRGFRP